MATASVASRTWTTVVLIAWQSSGAFPRRLPWSGSVTRKPHIKRGRKDKEAFAKAEASVATDVPCMSKGQRRRAAAEVLRGVFSPLAKFVLLKAKVFGQRGHLLDRHAALIAQMRTCSDMVQALGLMPQLDQLELDIDKASEPLAFASKGEDQSVGFPPGR